ncbi:PDR/VanB family oxidoreductase [Methylophilus methylotrophus]|uniref:PDR/VanB family oxidoreductase n=1 Tax=Methylophilus methylotrophus TaxID=17 RepID=UPI00035E97F9|nr:PDR/VanB family oxidoreductase [Methylophilus methylotrophus]
MSTINVKVAAVEEVTPLIKHFRLESEDGADLPPFSGGSHIVVTMDAEGRTYRNPYSLMGSPSDTRAYHISVRRQESSRGGSVFMHERVQVGMRLKITHPVNLFSLSKLAHKHILIAGGIGITPFMSQIEDLKAVDADYELHYAFRSYEQAAFVNELEEKCEGKLYCYADSQNERIDLTELLRHQPLGTHVYVCGPSPMVVAVLETARNLGWPENNIHHEEFSAPPVGEPFKVQLARSGIEVEVPAEMSMLEAIEEAGVAADSLCRGGVCGRCELTVLETDGGIQHHDHYLSDSEKVSCRSIMPCVSRTKGKRLVVDL